MKQNPRWFTLTIATLLMLSAVMINHVNVVAQASDCYWKLTEEKPRAFNASSAPDAVSTISGTTVSISWKGLTTTHTWSYPGATLKPGDEITIEVSVSWDVEEGSEAGNSTGGLSTSFNIGNGSPSASRSHINFSTEPSGSVSNSTVYTVPYGSKEGAKLSIYGFADAAVAGGRTDYIYIYFCPTPTATSKPVQTETPLPTATESPTATETITPTACPALTEQERYAEIIDRYYEEIPVGIGNSGSKLNIQVWFGQRKNDDYVCGWYQSEVLRFLEKIRTSDDPCESALLDKWDYAPIQAWWGFHQAVVLYPWATNWMETGTVLDPWIEQKPQIYEIREWAIHFSGYAFAPFIESQYTEEERSGASFRGIGPSSEYSTPGNFPIYGGSYGALGYELDLTREENAFIKTLPQEKKDIFEKMSFATRKQYLKMKLAGVKKVNRVVADCPLTLYLVDSNGARSGISGETVYDQLPNVYFMALPLEDGTIVTEMLYPQEAGYMLVLEGTGEGDGNVLIGDALLLDDPREGVQKYSFEVLENTIYKVATVEQGAPLVWSGGEVQPETLAGISEDWLDALPKLAGPEPIRPDGRLSGSILSRFVNWQPPLTGVVVLFVVGLVGLLLFTILLIIKLVNKNKQSDASQPSIPAVQKVLLTSLLLVSIELCAMGGLGIFNNLKESLGGSSGGSKAAGQTTPMVVVITSPVTATVPPLPTQTLTSEVIRNTTESPAPNDTSVTQSAGQYRDNHDFSDDFSSKLYEWPEINDGRKVLKYEDGGYSFQLYEKDDFDIVNLPVEFDPTEISFDVQGVEGLNDGTFGVFCQFQDSLNYYYVEFDLLTSQYTIAQSLDGDFIPLTVLSDESSYWHESEALLPADSVNHVSIICMSDYISVVLNEELVDGVFVENPFKQKGTSALFIYTYEFAGDEGYKVIFDNVKANNWIQ